MGLAEPGSPVWLSLSANPARKLRFSWELIEVAGDLVGINTGCANRLAEEAIRAVQSTRFQPATDAAGNPVDWEGVVNVAFQLAG